MRILAIDTANSYLSLSLFDGKNYFSLCEGVGNKQTEFILPSIEKLLSENNVKLNELDGIAYNSGPGGFTGLRICLSTAMSLAYSINAPLYPITMFAMYWQQQTVAENLLVCLDAKLGQVYLAGFDRYGNYLFEPCLLNPNELAAKLSENNLLDSSLKITGNGWSEYYNVFTSEVSLIKLEYIESKYPSAETMIELVLDSKVKACTPHNAELLYLRNKVALNLEEQKLAKSK